MAGKGRFGLAATIAALGLLLESSPTRAADSSPAYRAELRRTAELRKQRRRDRARPPGAIAAYPFPRALIIRHSPEVHNDIEALLDLLRR